ncbi:hypothetical protein [Falsiroseomonas sp. E2-1-a4]|uniref:hypothetical protein n=1 Tax=Falsiroseomonas sp. E2-1-a4 TaxID=3239299 RepID=UPI003F3B76DE
MPRQGWRTDTPRSHTIEVALSEAERAHLVAHASASRLPLSTHLRRHGLNPAGRALGDDAVVLDDPEIVAQLRAVGVVAMRHLDTGRAFPEAEREAACRLLRQLDLVLDRLAAERGARRGGRR